MKQRLWPVNKSLSHLHTFLSTFFFFHSFWFGLLAAWREEKHIYTEDFINTSGWGGSVKILNVKNDF